jgi:hypothetical protein
LNGQGEEKEDYFNKKKRKYKTVNENIETYLAGVLLRNNKNTDPNGAGRRFPISHQLICG